MQMVKSIVTIYRLPWGIPLIDREIWLQDREEGLIYSSTLTGERAAEEAFHLTNAPDECLSDDQRELLASLDFKGPSLSVGDVVRVAPYINKDKELPEYYLCKSYGWEKYDGETIPLIKHLSW
jgi:hypothetical protein